MTPSTLGLLYLYRPGVGILAATTEAPDDYRHSLVPSTSLAAATPGELEAIIAARDEAVARRQESTHGK